MENKLAEKTPEKTEITIIYSSTERSWGLYDNLLVIFSKFILLVLFGFHSENKDWNEMCRSIVQKSHANQWLKS
ncbi:MAG TPA: hypothetical protein VFU62_01490 [Hanamia sp.]|nr:hypothetical protein [Hanamia sp.]